VAGRAANRRSGSPSSALPQAHPAPAPFRVATAVEHRALPMAAVQFHPESILTLDGELGLRLIRNIVTLLCRP
jgi:anthranilate/para-aminobenzoate synthase component II